MQPELWKQGFLLMSSLASAGLWLKCGLVLTQQLSRSQLSCCLFSAYITPDFSSHKVGSAWPRAGSAVLLCFSAWPCPSFEFRFTLGLPPVCPKPRKSLAGLQVGVSLKPFEPHRVHRNREIFSNVPCRKRADKESWHSWAPSHPKHVMPLSGLP